MRYRLRTLLIVLALGPALLALSYDLVQRELQDIETARPYTSSSIYG